MSTLKLIALVYAAFILALGILAALDSLSLNYPLIIVLTATFTAFFLPIGVVAITLKWYPKWVMAHWRKVFIFCVIATLVGLYMDAVMPKDYSLLTDGWEWAQGALFLHALLLPGFYLNYKLAFHRRGEAA